MMRLRTLMRHRATPSDFRPLTNGPPPDGFRRTGRRVVVVE